MASDWIKMRNDLRDDPAVIATCAALKIEDPDLIVGKLHRLWGWATDHLVDGNAPGVTEMWIDRYTGIVGFSKQLALVGWLKINKTGVVFPHWERHLSQGAKARMTATARVQKHRSNDSVTSKALPDNNREEKNREEKTDKQERIVFLNRSAEQEHCLTCLLSMHRGGKKFFVQAAAESIAKNIRCTDARLRWAWKQFRAHSGKVKTPAAYLRSLIEGEDGPPITKYPEEAP